MMDTLYELGFSLWDLVLPHPRDIEASDMSGKVVLIVGGSQGIGLETARILAKCKPSKIIITVRTAQKGQTAISDLEKSTGYTNYSFELVELSSLKNTREFCQRMLKQEQKLDVLVLNAGLGYTPLDAKTEDGFQEMIQVNVLSHVLIADQLTPLLLKATHKPARVVHLSSSASFMAYGDLDNLENPPRHWMQLYGETKLFNVLHCKALAQEQRPDNPDIVYHTCHPGFVVSGFQARLPGFIASYLAVLSRLMGIPTNQGAVTPAFLASDPSIDSLTSGQFWSRGDVRAPNRIAQNRQLQEAFLRRARQMLASRNVS